MLNRPHFSMSEIGAVDATGGVIVAAPRLGEISNLQLSWDCTRTASARRLEILAPLLILYL